ncbi:MAG: hypothetical protein WCI38_11425 [Chthoniobacterales bacterium]
MWVGANSRWYKLLEKLDDQLAMVQALIDGEIFTRNRRVWQKNEAGERVLVERVKRTRPWYWMSGAVITHPLATVSNL